MHYKRPKLHHWQSIDSHAENKKAKKNKKIRDKQRIYLGKNLPGIYWTRREAQCVYYLALRKKRKCIATILGLSVRTIDSYLETAKAKLQCHTQRNLLNWITKNGFLDKLKELDSIHLLCDDT